MKKIYNPFNRLVITSLFVSLCTSSFAAQFPVTNTNDVGAGSLSAAIGLANSTPGMDTITFALTEGASMTIALATGLPNIDEAVFIDGYSQPGAAAGTISGRTIRININGAGIVLGALDIFTINAPNVTIAGLAIYGAPTGGGPNYGHGIKIENTGSNAFIWGNYIGTDSSGLVTGLGNNESGIVANLGSGTALLGITIGISSDGDNDANEGNLISCNRQDGIFFWATSNSTIAGNIIGFDKNGVGTGFGNGRNGILVTISANSNTIGTNSDSQSDNLEGNRIGNNNGRGIFIASNSNSNVITGNVIGLNSANAAAGNIGVDGHGIEINPGSGNRIGTDGDGLSDAFERNTICANAVDGIRITAGNFFSFTSNSDGNIIAGNAIGTNGAGTLVMGNAGNGILIQSNSDFNANDNIIGTNEDGNGDDVESNLIANNFRGVVIVTPTGASTHVGNRIARNSIYDNTQAGIDLGNDGTSANDNGDGDSGPNELYNFPIIKKSNVQAGNLVITGVAPAGSFIEFYIADANGTEGKTYLFSAIEGDAFDDSSGTDSYTDVTYGTFTDQKYGFTIPMGLLLSPVTAGTVIIAIAINTQSFAGNTSEFGPSFISTLPVRLLQFNGRVDNGIVYLNWNTSQEINNSHFDVERSSNGTSFEKIGTVSARGGITNAYSFNDTKAGTVNFYRLKQVDNNGTSTYSKTLLVRGDLDKIVAKVSPNPFRGSVNVSFQSTKAETVNVRLYNQTGQLVKQQSTKVNTGINSINLGDLNSLPAGNYTLELRGDTINFKQQVVKQ